MNARTEQGRLPVVERSPAWAGRMRRCGATGGWEPAARRGRRRGCGGCVPAADAGLRRGGGRAEGGRMRDSCGAVAGVQAGAWCGRVQVAAVGISVRSAGCDPGNLWKMRCDTPRLRDTKCYKAAAKRINQWLSCHGAARHGCCAVRGSAQPPCYVWYVSPEIRGLTVLLVLRVLGLVWMLIRCRQRGIELLGRAPPCCNPRHAALSSLAAPLLHSQMHCP